MYSTVKTLESLDRRERVLISRRLDGTYTYQRQWLSAASSNNVTAWGPPGPDCGIYDSADTAENEARQRVPWLRRLFS